MKHCIDHQFTGVKLILSLLRYTSDFKSMRQRRDRVRWKWLRDTILKLNTEAQKSLPEAERKRLIKRRFACAVTNRNIIWTAFT